MKQAARIRRGRQESCVGQCFGGYGGCNGDRGSESWTVVGLAVLPRELPQFGRTVASIGRERGIAFGERTNDGSVTPSEASGSGCAGACSCSTCQRGGLEHQGRSLGWTELGRDLDGIGVQHGLMSHDGLAARGSEDVPGSVAAEAALRCVGAELVADDQCAPPLSLGPVFMYGTGAGWSLWSQARADANAIDNAKSDIEGTLKRHYPKCGSCTTWMCGQSVPATCYSEWTVDFTYAACQVLARPTGVVFLAAAGCAGLVVAERRCRCPAASGGGYGY